VNLVLGAILLLLLSGFVIGVLARWAVPGPDPMPVWLTLAIGLGGSFIGSAIGAALIGANADTSGDVFTFLLLQVVAATLLVVAYRRFVQKRPITGPEAYRPPGGRRRTSIFASPAKRAYEREDTTEQIRKLAELRDSGALSDEEFEAKKRELLSRL
jgi:uncharacterized membrane protein YeaQ/YmgE (transglycosylase-associated protein family)